MKDRPHLLYKNSISKSLPTSLCHREGYNSPLSKGGPVVQSQTVGPDDKGGLQARVLLCDEPLLRN